MEQFDPSRSRSSPSPRSGGDKSLFIGDFKTVKTTRLKYHVPDEYKLQVMLYKYLLDDLLSSTFNWIHLFEINDLNSQEIFGDAFIAQIVVSYPETALAEARNLEDVVVAWKEAVESLNLKDGVVESELNIQYRLPEKSSSGKALSSSIFRVSGLMNRNRILF